MDRPHDNGIGSNLLTPDFVSKITAYRAWEWNNQPQSLAAKTIWGGKEMTASCDKKTAFKGGQPKVFKIIDRLFGINFSLLARNKNHVAPFKDCSCGLYGMFSLHKLQQYSRAPIIGVCEFWGKTEVHQDGLRSQFSQLKAICINHQRALVVEDNNTIYNLADPKNPVFRAFRIVGLFAALFSLAIGYALSSVFQPLLFVFAALAVLFAFTGFRFTHSLKKTFTKAVPEDKIRLWCKKNGVVFCESQHQLQAFDINAFPQV